jgi:monofunctional biosynthetic peptidoglycan transglycosylase
MQARGGDPKDIEQRTRQNWTPLDQVSPILICAVVKSEDRTFFRHAGFVVEAIERAAGRWATGVSGGGGSTITQQLARNLFLSEKRTLLRKARELLLSLQLEMELPKMRILEIYLNTAEWGPEVWGIGMASGYYFHSSPRSLTAFESAFLAALLPAPRSDPTGLNGIRIRAVQHRVLAQLARSRVIANDDAAAATFAADEFADAMSRGVSPFTALLQSSRTSGLVSTSPTLASAIHGECGLDLELREEAGARR